MKLCYNTLYSLHGLDQLHESFLSFLKGKELNSCNELVELGEYLEEFLADQLGIKDILSEQYIKASEYSLIAYAKRQFLQRYVLKEFSNPQDSWKDLYTFSNQKEFAEKALEALTHKTLDLENLAKYAAWAVLTKEGQIKHKFDQLFHAPKKIKGDFLLRHVTNTEKGYITTNPRNREGFSLTDPGCSIEKAADESHYCILCHHQNKDSCRAGITQNSAKPGCPLDQKI